MDDYRREARRRWDAQQQPQQQQPQQQQQQPARPEQPGGGATAKRSQAGDRGQGRGGSASTVRGSSESRSWNEAAGWLWDDMASRWSALSQSQQQQVMAGVALLVALMALGTKIIAVLALLALSYYLNTRLPNAASFEPYFREWFTTEYFPKICQKVQKELQEKSLRDSNMFSSLASQFKGWVMGKTESMQAPVYYEFAARHALPPTYSDLFFMRTAAVNLGSRNKPCNIVFWGIHGTWTLAPYISIDFENVSILDEMQNQGTR